MSGIAHYAFTLLIEVSQVYLSAAVTLFGGASIPTGSKREIGRHAQPLFIYLANISLRRSVACLGLRKPHFERCAHVGTVGGYILAAAAFALQGGQFSRAAGGKISELGA